MKVVKPHRAPLALGPRTAAPNLFSNGPSVAGSLSKEPSISDEVDIQQPRKSSKWLYVVAGLSILGAVTGHLTRVIPSGTIAEVLQDPLLEDLKELDQVGEFSIRYDDNKSPHRIYRKFGRMADSYYAPSFRFPDKDPETRGPSLTLRSPETVHRLANFLDGSDHLGLSANDIRIARDLYQREGLKASWDSDGALLALNLADGNRNNISYGSRRSITINDIQDLHRAHDYFFGGGEFFTDSERELLQVVDNHSYHWSDSGVYMLDKLKEGKAVSFRYSTPYDVRLERKANTREELLEYAEQLQGQVELDRYRPSAARLQQLMAKPMRGLNNLIQVSKAQLEAADKVLGREPNLNLSTLQTAEELAQKIESEIKAWDGVDGTALRQRIEPLLTELTEVEGKFERDFWNPYGNDRHKNTRWRVNEIRNILTTTEKEAPPSDWVEPANNLEGYVPAHAQAAPEG